MWQSLDNRAGHYLLLSAVSALLFLPNLGGPTLWDIDEGNNTRCAYEMMMADNWRVPTFNGQLRIDKPALLYWLQIMAFEVFGVGEFAARLPSALAALAAVLLTYELGRRLFGAACGLLAGLMVSSSVMFCAAAHFANPDALLTASTTLIFLCFWPGFVSGRLRFALVGASMGLAVLAKGPVGLVLPFSVICLFLAACRQTVLLRDRRFLLGVLGFLLVALPWYLWVGVDTKFEFVRRFVTVHNVGRFLQPMENHSGPFYYYVVALVVGFVPWSVFLVPVCWDCVRQFRKAELDAPARGVATSLTGASGSGRLQIGFLACWIGVYVIFFSISRTKLPNYILPIYPAIALLTARFLVNWQRGLVDMPTWMMRLSLVALAVVGVGAGVVLATAGGAIAPPMASMRQFAGLERWAPLGLILIAGAMLTGYFMRGRRRTAALLSLVASAVLFLAPLAAGVGSTLNPYKAPRDLARAIKRHQTEREIRIGSYAYTQPSLVFYCARDVSFFTSEEQTRQFLQTPLQVFLVTPAPTWDRLTGRVKGDAQLLGRFRDMYLNCDIVVVSNR